MLCGLCVLDGWMDGRTNRWMDEWMGGWVGGWMDGWYTILISQFPVRQSVLQSCFISDETSIRSNLVPEEPVVCLQNLPGTVDEDYIEMFFENKLKAKVTKVEINQETNSAVVVLENKDGRHFIFLFILM